MGIIKKKWRKKRMKSKNELSYKDLKMTCNENLFNFNTTETIKPPYRNDLFYNKCIQY